MSNVWDCIRLEKRMQPSDPEQAERMRAAKKLCREVHLQIPYRTSDQIHSQLWSLAAAWIEAGVAVEPCGGAFDGFIDIKRAWMARRFLSESKRKYLVMLDNDVIPMAPEGLVQLVSHGLPVVSGIACGYSVHRGLFACVAVKDPSGAARFPSVQDQSVLPGHGIAEVECCGTGFVAIRRDVLEAFADEPFILPHEVRIEAARTGHMRLTEDTHFSYQCRTLGFKLYADFEVRCFHDKTIPVSWPADRIIEGLDAKDWDPVRGKPLAAVGA